MRRWLHLGKRGCKICPGISEDALPEPVVYEFPYVRQTKDWFYFVGGSVTWSHKSKLISYEIIASSIDTTMIRFKVSKDVAQAVGLPFREASGMIATNVKCRCSG